MSKFAKLLYFIDSVTKQEDIRGNIPFPIHHFHDLNHNLTIIKVRLTSLVRHGTSLRK